MLGVTSGKDPAPVRGDRGRLFYARARGARAAYARVPRVARVGLAVLLALVPLGIALAAMSTAPTGRKAWTWQNPTPQGNALYAVDTVGANAWAVGGPGVILRSTDGGASWTSQDSNSVATLRAVDFADSQSGWAVGAAFGGAGTIRRTADGGATWTTQTAGTASGLYGASMVDTSTGWVAGENGTVLRTWDGGGVWAAQGSGTTAQLNGVSAVDTNTAWVVGAAGTIRSTTDGGATWTGQTSNTTAQLNAVSFVSTSTGWAVGDAVAGISQVRKTVDGGATWTTQTVSSSANLYGVRFVSTTTGWIVGDGGLVRYTTDGGTTWIAQDAGSVRLLGVAASSGSAAQVVGLSGAMLRTTDAGQTWTAQLGAAMRSLNEIAAVSTSTAWAVGDAGVVLSTTNGGASWVRRTTGTSDLEGVSFADASIGWVVGAGGAIRKTVDGGATWAPQTSTTALQLNAVAAGSTQTVVAAGPAGYIVRTTDGGATWAQVALPNPAVSRGGVWFATPSVVVLVGDNRVLRSTDSGATWAVVNNAGGGVVLNAVTFGDASTGWVVGNAGVIEKTTDGGATWVPLTSGTTADLDAVTFADANNGWAMGGAAGAPSVVLHTTDGGATWTAQNVSMTGMCRGAASAGAQTAWLVDNAGAVRKTSDAGATWSSQSYGTTNNLADVSFPTVTTGYAVGASGLVMRTVNGGTSWARLATATASDLSAADFVSASAGWAVGAGGTIVRTANGLDWATQAATPTVTLRGVDFADANNGVAVGDRSTILRTTDAGLTWAAQPSGLATDMAIYGVSFADASNGWAVAATASPTGSAIIRTSNGGATWSAQPVGLAVNLRLRAVSMVTTQTGYVVGDGGTIRKTVDGGSTWVTQTAPVGTTALYAVHFVDADHGVAAGDIDPATNQAVTIVTEDGGATWTAVPTGSLSVVRSVALFDLAHGWVAGDTGAILLGDLQAPTTAISLAPAAPDGLNGWYVTTPTVTLTPDEPATTYYSIDATGLPYATYGAPFTVSVAGTHTVRWYSIDPAGNRETTRSATLKVDLAAPTVPTSVTAAAVSTTSVSLAWAPSLDTVSGLDHYSVWQDGVLATTTVATSAVFTGLPVESPHTYVVRAVDVAGNTSSGSPTATAWTWALLSRPPAAVYARHVYRGAFAIDWDEPTSTVGAVSYRVWRSDAGAPFVAIANLTGLLNRSWVDTTAPDPTPIAYAVSVIDARGQGATSTAMSSASATTPALPAPTGLRAVAVTGSVETSWASLPATGVASYVVLRSATSTGAPATVTPAPILVTSFSDTSTVAHAEYWYRVAAIDLAGVRGALSLPVYVRASASSTADVPHGAYTADTDACALCHSTHRSTNATDLLTLEGSNELPLCYSCHDGTSASDVLGEFSDTSRGHRHAVPAGTQPGTMRCADCHDPHGEKGAPRRRLLYNDGARTGDAICYNGCHGATATVEPRGDLRIFESSGHASATPAPADTQVKCLVCHESHSTREPSLYPYAPDDRCVTCHSLEGAVPGAADIRRTLSGPDATTRHDLLSADQAATGARLACGNCHEPHSSTPTTKVVDPRNPTTAGGWSGTGDDFCLRCHTTRLPTSTETSGWVLPPLGSGGTTYTSDIASRWAGDIHGGLVRAPTTLRADMGYLPGDPVACQKCHEPHGSANRWNLRESVTSKSGTLTVSGLLVYPVGSGADVRFFCNACHDVTPASHPTTAAGGADISVFPMDCISSGCHRHGVSGL